MQGLDPTDPEVVAAGGQGLQVEASQGASGEEAVEGESHRGGSRVPGGRASGVLASSESGGARGGGGRGRRIGGGGGRPGAALDTVCPCYNGPRYNGNLVIPDALTSQSHLAITDKLKFWWSRYNGNLVLQVRYHNGRLYVVQRFVREIIRALFLCCSPPFPLSGGADIGEQEIRVPRFDS